jgi:hypothetical protein
MGTNKDHIPIDRHKTQERKQKRSEEGRGKIRRREARAWFGVTFHP